VLPQTYVARQPAACEKFEVRPVQRGQKGKVKYLPYKTVNEVSQMGPELKEVADMTG
jgi:hypothetical protein